MCIPVLTGNTLDNLDRAHHYRDEAARLRRLAAKDCNPATRENLMAVAAKYDGLYDKYLTLAMATPQRPF